MADADDAGADAVAGASRGLYAYVYGLFIDCRFLTESYGELDLAQEFTRLVNSTLHTTAPGIAHECFTLDVELADADGVLGLHKGGHESHGPKLVFAVEQGGVTLRRSVKLGDARDPEAILEFAPHLRAHAVT